MMMPALKRELIIPGALYRICHCVIYVCMGVCSSQTTPEYVRDVVSMFADASLWPAGRRLVYKMMLPYDADVRTRYLGPACVHKRLECSSGMSVEVAMKAASEMGA